MAKEKVSQSRSKEEIKMRKFIVEAPEPKEGQKISSGGIRENGKLTAQFKNPIPYEEPVQPPAVIPETPQNTLPSPPRVNNLKSEAGRVLLGIIWQEFGEPLLRSGLRKLGDVLINKIESKTLSSNKAQPKEQRIIDVEAEEVKPAPRDNIINIQSRRAV